MTGQLCEFELFLSSKCFEAPEAGPETPQPESREDGMLSILILEWFVILLGQSRDNIAKHGEIFVARKIANRERRMQRNKTRSREDAAIEISSRRCRENHFLLTLINFPECGKYHVPVNLSI